MKIKNELIQILLDDMYKTHIKIPNFTHLIKGEYRPVNRFPDRSFSALKKNCLIYEQYMDRVRFLKTSNELSNFDRLMLDVAEYFLNTMMFPVSPLQKDYYYLDFGITPYEFPIEVFWGSLSLFQCTTPKQVRCHMELAEDLVRYARDMYLRVKEQASRGIYLFSEVIPATCQMLRQYAGVPYEDHPFCMRRTGSVATEEQVAVEREWIKQAGEYWFKIAHFLESGEYQQKAPKEPGWGQFERGLEYYRYLRNYHLGWDISASDLHALGNALLQEAVVQQTGIRKRLGFSESHQEFLDHLRGDERFYPTTPERLGALMRNSVEKTAASMGRYFFESIQTPYRVERLNPEMEASLTFGFFQPSVNKNQPGIYFYNGSGLEEKCQLTSAALLAHEVLPGHHFQQSYINECEEIHPLVKLIFAPSCLEGWAEYCARFLGEIGVFDDYDEYGRLENEKFASARLIVDTGLNELGWSMDQARRFLVENTFATEDMAISETNRYAYCIPAQCLSYRYGSLKLVEIRERYRNGRKDQYDVRDFHSMVLNAGCIPLALLEKYIEQESL